MSKGFELYYSPGSVSLVSHVALIESQVDYQLRRVDVFRDEQHQPAYASIHPLRRVPALRLDSGELLTETPAIVSYLAERYPQQLPLGDSGLERARVVEWLSFFASGVHASIWGYLVPARFVDDAGAQQKVKEAGKLRFWTMLQKLEERLPSSGYVQGERDSILDVYVYVFLLWAKRLQLPIDELQKCSILCQRVAQRPAVLLALQREGLLKSN